MSTTIKDEVFRKALIRQAAAWRARNEGGELSASEKLEFLHWLRTSPDHIDTYLRTAYMTQLLPRVAAVQNFPTNYQQPLAVILEPSNVLSLNTALGRKKAPPGKIRRLLQRGKTLSLVAALMIVVGIPWAITRYMSSQGISVPHGDQRTLRLEDGSVAHLNSESEVRVLFTPERRLIELVKGQALFKVAHNKSRPFVVRAGATEVLAVGTQFEVYRASADTTVTVVEGKVEVLERRDPDPSIRTLLPADQANIAVQAIPLVAGERIRVRAQPRVVEPVKVNVREATAWTRREISFHSQPLGEVASEYGRYLDKPIRIEDETLRETRVTGLFQAYEPEPFLRFLRAFPDVIVDEEADAIYVRRRAPVDP